MENGALSGLAKRNGYRSRAWDTRVGTMDLHIPKLSEGSYFTEPAGAVAAGTERALLAVIPPARRGRCIQHRPRTIWPRLPGVKRYFQGAGVALSVRNWTRWWMASRCRPLDSGLLYPTPWLAALTQPVMDVRQDRQHQRGGGDGQSMAPACGRSSGLTCDTSEDGAFWTGRFLTLDVRQAPRRGGAGGIETLIRDSEAPSPQSPGRASWQRCRTRFMTNRLTRVPRRVKPWVATMVLTIYQQLFADDLHA